jgi:Smr domain
MASIDLHGYRKSDAISRLTEFLDQTTRKHHRHGGPCWVEVVTGSGAHSLDGRKFFGKDVLLSRNVFPHVVYCFLSDQLSYGLPYKPCSNSDK